ncbi:MAG TPA: PP2C family serine/threonine-protein phosphatase [Pyrinomonadaceae bacterium]|nr:PP2C family serine/threonine-protein phosphatase [Pyrinomonadaceae bacterium]
MSQPINHPAPELTVKSSAVTDRGLSEKRPLNEDSFLADAERGIFSVADGVGGAEAGEVASQTAIEVLDEAFRHKDENADIEDLMELAIQRANASIHKMAQEHAKFAMMATTIVALHIKNNIATIGHVGDSRLYRLSPDGHLSRETEDHSVVEEEVRAGRMTAEQAANHPSKNIISRALGAEDGVEVDMKVMEVEDGTQFLLCTDGITRHIPDYELRQLMILNEDLPTLCAALKERCYERGAEDNLTAVVVRVGTAISAATRSAEMDETLTPEASVVPTLSAAQEMDTVETAPAEFVPASRKAFPGVATRGAETLNLERTMENAPVNIVDRPRSGGFLGRFILLLLVLGAVAAAFYGGRKYKGPIPFIDADNQIAAQPSPTATAATPQPYSNFETERRDVDRDPAAWLSTAAKSEISKQGIQNALDSNEPEFLYLYGRASLLTGSTDEAVKAFEAAIAKATTNPSPENVTLRKEATLALAAAALKSDKDKPAAQTHFDEIMQKPSATMSPAVSQPTP